MVFKSRNKKIQRDTIVLPLKLINVNRLQGLKVKFLTFNKNKITAKTLPMKKSFIILNLAIMQILTFNAMVNHTG